MIDERTGSGLEMLKCRLGLVGLRFVLRSHTLGVIDLESKATPRKASA